MKWLVWLLVLLIVPAVFAQEGSIKLLALSESSNGVKSGIVADLDLIIEPGNHRVFLETFPLTKITTQISMRFAQQVACKELDIDCSGKDFFFTVRALPGIVGGPSAGSSAAVLVASIIADLELRNDTAVTGTINSGGVIGPVGGIKEKIDAAKDVGITRVLIPPGTGLSKDNKTNTTTDLVAYGKEIGIEVIEVSSLLAALHEFTGEEFPIVTGELVIEPVYLETMKEVAQDLCDRNDDIRLLLKNQSANLSNITELEENALQMRNRSKTAFDLGQYYSSASYCFRSNVQLKRAMVSQISWNENKIARALIGIRNLAANFSQEVDKIEVSTITDLQTYMAVKERLFDVSDSLGEILLKLNETEENAKRLAYAEERLFSAVTWARFFNGNDKKFVIDSASLRNSCMSKIGEAEERINYVRSFLPKSLVDARRELDKAYKDLSNNNYTLCLYKASKTKAEADVILNAVGVDEENVEDLIDLKLKIARDAVIKSQQKGIFPIIGYSYYEYATSLKDMDKYSSLLFAEYAMEFSNLDIYFAKKRNGIGLKETVKPHLPWILVGIIIGLFIAIIFESLSRIKLDRKPKKRKR